MFPEQSISAIIFMKFARFTFKLTYPPMLIFSVQGWVGTVVSTVMLIAIGLPVSGQVLMVDQAYALLKSGDLNKSRQAIDIAVEHPSTKNDARTWYLRSFIYQELAQQDSSEKVSLRNISIQSALNCLKVDSLNRFSSDCEQIASNAYISFLNDAIISLNAQNYTDVFPSLKPVIDSNNIYAKARRPEALFYYGYALIQLGNKERAREYFFKALQSGYQDPLVYDIEFQHRMKNSETDSAQWYLTAGRQLFPKDPGLQVSELNLLMQQANYIKAEEVVEQYITQYPDNIEGLLLAGTIYEKLLANSEEKEPYFPKQISVYQRILQINPDHLQANYNLGIAYYNRGVKLINGATQNYDLDLEEFNRLLHECSSLFLTALPYLQKVNTLDSDHVNALKALEGVYYNINDYEQYNLVKTKLQKL